MPAVLALLCSPGVIAAARHAAPAPAAAPQAPAASAAPAAAADASASDGLAPGEVLDQRNWEKAKGLLPPEILEHYRRGEYKSKIMEWKRGQNRWSKAFEASTRANGKRLTVDERGTIIDRRTGKQPPYVYGFPFPHIDPKDPRAAVKIIWNVNYGYWNQGNLHNITMLNWVNRAGLEREVTVEAYFLYWDGQPRELIPGANPQNLLQQSLASVQSPTDLFGTTSLSWRYRTPDQRDSTWTYVPALRRVRQVSPTNRSDGFLGSDMSQDDGVFFDGKPEDFRWRLVGEKELYRFTDPYTLRGEVKYEKLPGGGWRGIWSSEPKVGYQDPKWKGLPWAPIAQVLTRRRHWVVEAIPRDRYYLFGRIELYVDQETFRGAWSRKFDWKGELLTTISTPGILNFTPDGKHYFYNAAVAAYVAESVKLERATVAGPPPDPSSRPPADARIPLSPSLFEVRTLARLGQ